MGADNENLARNREIYAKLGRVFESDPAVRRNAHFLNWGYEPVEGISDWLPSGRTPPTGINRQHRRLALELIGDIPIDGRSILDIGCGRGGVLKTMIEHYRPRRVTGIDISPENIESCRETVSFARSRFQVADACNPPMRDQSHDIVINLESSGAYPDFSAFLEHVARILRHGGYFLFADVFPAAIIPVILRALGKLGLEIVAHRNITPNILAARQDADAREKRLFNRAAATGEEADRTLSDFLDRYRADSGSDILRAMADGEIAYYQLQAQKGSKQTLDCFPDRLRGQLAQREKRFRDAISGRAPDRNIRDMTERWFPFGPPDPENDLRVFAFPHAAGGASIYRDWVEYFDTREIAFCPVLFPGREQRLSEAPLANMAEMVDGALAACSAFVDRPFVLMGHSLGARVVFELGLKFEEKGNDNFKGIIAAGCPAPDIPAGMKVGHMEREALCAQLGALGGTPATLLEDGEGIALYEKSIRADFAIGENYLSRHEQLLNVPVMTIAATRDRHVSERAVRGWQRATAGKTVHNRIEAGHFFIKEDREDRAKAMCLGFMERLARPSSSRRAVKHVGDGKWLPFGDGGDNCALRLFCFAFAGGTASYFNSWRRYLPAGVALCPVELPGHGTRFSEDPVTDTDRLIPALSEAIAGKLDQPFAFFGHSLGALIAYLAARYLREHHDRIPSHLFISGHRAPHRSSPEPYRHLMSDAELSKDVETLGGTVPEISQNREFMRIVLPLMRADFRLTECYRHQESDPLDFPVTAYAGDADTEVPPIEIEHWKLIVGKSFRSRIFAGGHFYLNDPRVLNELLCDVCDDIAILG